MPEPLPTVADALAEHGWSQADAALARGWRENAVLERELRALARTQPVRASARVAEKVASLLDQCLLVGQSLSLAAGQRGLSFLGHIGDEMKYDTQRHEAIGAEPRRGAPVRVVAPGIISEARRIVLVKADVAPKPVSRSRRAQK
jgi:hypothetical protein